MIKWILLFIIFVAAVHYFNIDMRSMVEYAIGASSVVWNYIKDPILYAAEVIKTTVSNI